MQAKLQGACRKARLPTWKRRTLGLNSARLECLDKHFELFFDLPHRSVKASLRKFKVSYQSQQQQQKVIFRVPKERKKKLTAFYVEWKCLFKIRGNFSHKWKLETITSRAIIGSLGYITIINAYAPNYISSKYVKQKQLKGEIDRSSITAGNFNTPPSATHLAIVHKWVNI